MKKLISIMMCILMLLTLVACGQANPGSSAGDTSNQGSQTAPESDAPESTAPAVASSSKTVIEYWHINSATFGGPTIDEYVSKFSASQDQYEVAPRFIEGVYGGIMQNLQAEVAAGNAPGVVQIGYPYLDYFSRNFSFVSPAEMVANDDSVDASFLDGFAQNTLALSTNKDGVLVGLPYSLSVPVMYYNRDMLRSAGLDAENLPTTWEQVYDYARKITSETGEIGLVLQCSNDFWLAQCVIECNGGKMAEMRDGKMYASLASPEGIEAMQGWADIIKEGASAYILGEEAKSAFMSGNIGILAGSIGWCAAIDEGSSFDLMTAGMPAYGSKERNLPSGGNFLAVTAITDEVKAGAWEWMKYLTSEQGYLDWTKGTGYVPPRTDLLESNEFKAYLETNSLLEAATSTMIYARPFISYPGDAGLEAEQMLLDARDVIMNSQDTAANVLPRVQSEINALLEAQE